MTYVRLAKKATDAIGIRGLFANLTYVIAHSTWSGYAREGITVIYLWFPPIDRPELRAMLPRSPRCLPYNP